MRTLFTVIWFLICSHAFSQSVYKIRMNIERVAINHTFPTIQDTRTVLIVIEGKYFGLYTGYDTLYLERVKPLSKDPVIIYRDTLHEDQPYYMLKVKTDIGFSIFIAPIKPYLRPRLWGINLTSI